MISYERQSTTHQIKTGPAEESAEERLARRDEHIAWLRQALQRPRPLSEAHIAKAWRVAHTAARILRMQYGVTQVRVFGSLIHPLRFGAGSDVDLAVRGLAVSRYWDALAGVLFLDDEISIDLVDTDTCPEDLRAIIEREGVEI